MHFIRIPTFMRKEKRITKDDFQLLLEKCKNNNRKAGMDLYHLFAHSIYNTCFRMINNSFEAENIMHESFLIVFKKINEFNGSQQEMLNYINKIAINKCLKLMKKKNIFTTLEDIHNEVSEDEIPYSYEPLLSVENIHNCLKKLPDGYRIIVGMHLVEKISFTEIAELLELKPSSVRSQYARGLEKLITHLKKIK